jgi:hypothetical protein
MHTSSDTTRGALPACAIPQAAIATATAMASEDVRQKIEAWRKNEDFRGQPDRLGTAPQHPLATYCRIFRDRRAEESDERLRRRFHFRKSG